MPAPTASRSFVQTALGPIHLAACGEGVPLLLLHQTPRSWDEYRDVLPRLGGAVRAIAMDTPGFGDSPPLAHRPPSIEGWSEAVVALLDALEIETAWVAGHHTGAVVAMEVAARAPGRVGGLILSSCPLVDAARRERYRDKTPIDTVSAAADGAHLLQLWQGRAPFYPPNRPDLLERFLVDALRAGPMAAEGHRVVNRYRMEDRIGLVRAPTLVIAACDDPHAFPAARPVAQAIPGAELVEIAGGTVPLPDAMPAEFSAAILTYLQRLGILSSTSPGPRRSA